MKASKLEGTALEHFEKSLNFLAEKLRRVILDGKLIVVIGWKESNHNSFTKSIPKNKVRFLGRMPRKPPDNTGLMLFTRFTNHAETERGRKWNDIHSSVLTLGTLRSLLKSLSDILMPVSIPTLVYGDGAAREESIETTMAEQKDEEEKEVHTKRKEKEDEDPLRVFTDHFMRAVDHRAERSLSKYKVTDLCRKVFGNERYAKTLVLNEWLEPIVKEGAVKAGAYKAGVQMLNLLTEPEPADPIAKARYLIQSEGTLLRQKEELTAEIARVEKELQRIEEARNLLQKLEELVR